MKTIFSLITFCSLHAFGQQKDAAKKEVQKLPEWVRVMDSIIDDSNKKQYDFTHISRLITEGSITMIDTINYHVQLTSNDDSCPKDIKAQILSEAKYAIRRKR